MQQKLHKLRLKIKQKEIQHEKSLHSVQQSRVLCQNVFSKFTNILYLEGILNKVVHFLIITTIVFLLSYGQSTGVSKQSNQQRLEPTQKKVMIDIWGGWSFGIVPPERIQSFNGLYTTMGPAYGLDAFLIISPNFKLGVGGSYRKMISYNFALPTEDFGLFAIGKGGVIPVLAEIRFQLGPVVIELDGGYAFFLDPIFQYYSSPTAGGAIGLQIPLGRTFAIDILGRYLAFFSPTGLYSRSSLTMAITPSIGFVVKF